MSSNDEFMVQHCVEFKTPIQLGVYELRYSQVLMFPSDYHVTEFDEQQLISFARQSLKRYSTYVATLAHLRVSENTAPVPFSTYLRLNGQTPALGARVEPGIDKPPLIFSWFIQPKRDTKDLEHRYRLYPVETEWSPWTSESQAIYYFVGPGSHQFQVVSRVRSVSGHWTEGQQADYQFFLEKPLIAKPITKASQGTAAKSTAFADLATLYSKSRALLIGVTTYEDHQFGPLPYTKADVTRLETTLQGLGFEVNSHLGPITKTEMTKAIDRFARVASKHERLLIYLSTHGFADSLDRSKGYVVSSDCRTDQPSTCLSLQEVEGLLQPVLKADKSLVRHLLVLLDTCSSGLGVIAKSGRYNELSVASKEGSHLMTAGLAEQQAEQDPRLGMSTFTYYLTEGLLGKADYTQDRVVSLSELLVYVRYNVATYTGGRQTPMVGRISGGGEMIFPLSEQKAK